MRIVTAQEVNELFRSGKDVIVLDVLGAESYRQRHLPGAINVPVDSPDFEERVRTLVPDKTKTIVTYCSDESCEASPKAYRRLETMGYADLLEFKAGLKGWEEAGFQFESAPTRGVPSGEVAAEE